MLLVCWKLATTWSEAVIGEVSVDDDEYFDEEILSEVM